MNVSVISSKCENVKQLINTFSQDTTLALNGLLFLKALNPGNHLGGVP